MAVDDSEEKMHWLSVLGGNAHGRRRFAAVRGKGTQLKKRATGEDGKDDEEGGGMMLIEPQHMIQSIFLDCDKDNDGALSASEYSAFLRTIGSWGKHKYTDAYGMLFDHFKDEIETVLEVMKKREYK